MNKECKYYDECTKLENRYNVHNYCLFLIEKCIEDNEWKERITYNFTPQHKNWDSVKTSLFMRNPNNLNISKPDSCKKGLEYTFLPITYAEKPLLYNFKITINKRDGDGLISIPSRIESSEAIAAIFLKKFRLLQDFNDEAVKNGFKKEDVIFFISSLISCSGNRKNKYANELSYRKGIYRKYIKCMSIPWFAFKKKIYALGCFFSKYNSQKVDTKCKLEKLKSYTIVLDSEKKKGISNIDRMIDSAIKKFCEYQVFFKELKSKLNRKKFDECRISITKNEANKLLCRFSEDGVISYLVQQFKDVVQNRTHLYSSLDMNSPLLNPYIAIGEYYYHPKEDTTYIENADIEKFFKLSSIYLNLLKIQIPKIMKDNELTLDHSNLLKEFVTFEAFTSSYFMVLLKIPTSQEQVEVSIDFAAKGNKAWLRPIYRYQVNLGAAKSVHCEINSQEIGYRVCDIRTKPKNIFGRIKTTSTLNHMSTRKKKTLVPYTKSNSFIDNLCFVDSMALINVKYRLSYFLSITMMAFAAFLIYTFLFLSKTEVILFSALLPIATLFLSLFSLGKWSLAHQLLNKYKVFFTLFIILLMVKYIFVEKTALTKTFFDFIEHQWPKSGILIDKLSNFVDNLIRSLWGGY